MTIVQPSLADIGEPLSSTTFVVVDLETTGGSPNGSAITEIGAVKTRGGVVLGEFHTLVDPGQPIPPMIVALTGITDLMVSAAPRIEAVLPAFLEFLSDAVVVAHNAPFDVGFLKAACRDHQYRWPGNEVVDTVTLARRVTTKEEAPNKKLSTLARIFGAPVQPTHRALDDAKATSHILHAMIERLAAFGITHREDLAALRNPMPEALRKKASMADAVPAKPGVYIFRGPQGERLYIGTSTNLRSRVKSYFTTGEQRARIRDMLALAVSVDTLTCASRLEANVLEARLIHQYRPRYNIRSTRPERAAWIRLTDERYPRLSVVRSLTGEGTVVGPMGSAVEARLAVAALQHAMAVRTCTTRLPIVPRANARACLLLDLGQCAAPCVGGESSGYDDVAAAARSALAIDPSPVVAALAGRIADHAERLEFERAAELRDGVSAVVAGLMRAQRLASLVDCSLVAAHPSGSGWDLAAIAGGRLTGAAQVDAGVWAAADHLREGWHIDPLTVTLIEERELVMAWLERPGVRLLYVEGEWAQPVAGAARLRRWVDARRADQEQVGATHRR